MTGAHLHLLLTHIPVIGIVFGLFITGFGLIRKKIDVLRTGFALFVFSGIAAAAVYVTGESAEEVVEGMAGVSHAIIEQHEEAAFIALIATLALAAASLIGLWLARKTFPRRYATATLIGALAVAGVVAWTANLGGQINHPEIRPGASITASNDAGGGDAGSAVRHDDDDGD